MSIKIPLSIFAIVLIALVFSACTRYAKPNNIDGKYFMLDGDCKKYEVITDTKIKCFNSDGEEIGFKEAMTNQELQTYKYEKAKKSVTNREYIKMIMK